MLQETQVFSHQRGFVSALVCNIVVVCECHAGGKCIDHDDDDDDGPRTKLKQKNSMRPFNIYPFSFHNDKSNVLAQSTCLNSYPDQKMVMNS